MRTIKFYVAIAVLALVTVSCVENSSKYKAVVAQRDSLAMQTQSLDSSYNQTLVFLNDIEAGFAKINQNESAMKVNLKGAEGSTSRRERIGAQMMEIQKTMEQNKAKIIGLQRLAAKNKKANAMLQATIQRLQSELDAQNAQIQSLQAELEQKNIKINELNTTVAEQGKNIADQNNVIEQQQSTLKDQDANLHTVWYCVAPIKQLKEEKIVTGGGLFQSKKLSANAFDPKYFTQADLRTISSIPTNSKRVKILSLHPTDSYKLVTGSDKKITIEITNSSKFWSDSKYLIVQI
jgi:predicted  nucleic acid-binding Zn-ribbon protein